MKKKILNLCVFIICIWLINPIFSAYAMDTLTEIQNKILNEGSLTDLVTGEAKNILGDATIDVNIDLIEESYGIFERCFEYFKEKISSITILMIKIITIVMIASSFNSFVTSSNLKNVDTYINMATVISISIIALVDVKSVLNLCVLAISEINILSKGLIPTMVTAITLSGCPTTGGLLYSISMLFFDSLITLIDRILFPFVYLYIAVITVNATIGNNTLVKIADFIKWISLGSLKILLTLFITFISLSGVISGTVDTFAIKTTKLAMSTAIPIVGSVISDASETILIGASIVKNAIGIYGIFALISICAIPIINIFVNFLMFKLASVIVSPVSTKEVSNLLDSLSQAFNMALAMIFTSFLIFFAMIVASIILVRGT